MEELLKLLPELSDEVKAELEKAFSAQYEKGRSDLIKEQEKSCFDEAVTRALEDAGAIDTEIAFSVMDMENVIFEAGDFLGLSDEIDRVKSQYGFLFHQDGPQFSAGNSDSDEIDLSALNYLERLRLYRENPELYKLHRNNC